MRKTLLAVLGIIMISFMGYSAEFYIPGTSSKPQIDGKIDKDEWSRALVLAGAGGLVDQRKSQCFITFDEDYLYLAVQSELPPKGKLMGSRPFIVNNDSIELWFDPPKSLRTLEQGKFGEFQLIASFKGELLVQHYNPGYGLSTRQWKIDGLQIANGLDEAHWDIELAIPAKAFGLKAIDDADWKLMAVRNFGTRPGCQVPFSPCNAFSDTQSFATYHFRKSAPAIRHLYKEDSRIPVIVESDSEGLQVIGTANGQAFEGKTPFEIPVDTQKAGKFELKVVDNLNQVLMSRELSFDAPKERLWFMPEAYICLEQDYETGNVHDFVIAEKNTSIALAADTERKMVPGKEKGSKALYMAENSKSFQVKGTAIPVPGNISLWIKPDKIDKAKTWRRYFSSAFRTSGYFGMQIQPEGYGVIFLHEFGNNLNLILPRIPVAEVWSHISLNLLPNRIEYYLNGVKQSELDLPFTIDPKKLGEFTVGGGSEQFALDSYRLYSRVLEPDEIRDLAQGEQKISGTMGYYPSLNAIVLDINIDSEKLQGKTLLAEVRDSKLNTLMNTPIDCSKGNIVQTDAKRMIILHQTLPFAHPLEDGSYNMCLHFKDDEEILLEKNFPVKHYAWEKNSLGKEDRLFPGFTPLKSNGNTLSCVLRDYEIGDNGLPRQMKSLGEELLASAVALKLEKNGNVTSLDGGTFAILSQTDTKISYRSTVNGYEIQGLLEQDGLLKLDITFPEKIDAERVFMEIPVRKEIATLYHAVGEHIRANPAGFIPDGQGLIFNSRSVSQIHVSNFIPYIWVGSDERGICYAADWDRGWIHSEERDAVELHRNEKGDVSIRLNLLNGPIPTKQGRVITLALMASPVKPMPEGWRGWADGFVTKCTRLTQCLPSPPYWGGYQAWSQRYPAWEDFEYIRKLKEAQDTGVIDNEFIKKWLARLDEGTKEDVPWITNQDKDKARIYAQNHTNAGFYTAKGLYGHKDANLYFYTCDTEGTGNLKEHQFFADEWRANSGVSGSYQDYAIYYLDKMLENGMSGIYNDNTFFRCCYAWATGHGYIDEQGVVHPSFCLWESREYRRRELNVLLNHGLNPWITVHHTNANILPTLGYATNSMGMEWKYGTQDFQERFTPDYIRAVCQGLQGGFYPTVLDGISGGNKEEQQWATRTMLASLLPHEIRPVLQRGSDPAIIKKIFNIMFDFGRHEKDCVYTAYWNPANPVVSSDKNLLVSTYARDSRLLCVCGSFTGDLNAELKANAKVISAKNAETGEKLEVADNLIRFFLKKHDFILVEVELEQK